MADPRFPIGPEPTPLSLSPAQRAEAIAHIRGLPADLRAAVAGLDAAQLDTPYREGGWTVRQVVHHVADSHINAYVRTKLTLTEENPTVKPYQEQLWAELPDSRLDPELSLALLERLHTRWVAVLEGLKPEDFQRPLTHPVGGQWTLDTLLGIYAWHGRHHVAHITELRKARGWPLGD